MLFLVLEYDLKIRYNLELFCWIVCINVLKEIRKIYKL